MAANANSAANAQCERILKVKLGELLIGSLALVEYQIQMESMKNFYLLFKMHQ